MAERNDEWMVHLTWTDPTTGEFREFKGQSPISIGRYAEQNDIPLNSRIVSGNHVRLEKQGKKLIVVDLGSRNGTIVNGQRISQAEVTSGSSFQIGPFAFTIVILRQDRIQTETTEALTVDYQETTGETKFISGEFGSKSSLTFSPETDVLVFSAPISLKKPPTFPPRAMLQAEIVSIDELERLMPLEIANYVAVGGGLGSFTWVDHLMVFGADPSQIVSIGFEAHPYGRYRRLCQNSQIPPHERLRSNSDSCPDNIWGWPGYAVREVWQDIKRGRLGAAGQVAWKIFNEPFVETYTPKSENVFASIDREAKRIGWSKIWRHGRVRAIRKTDDGRYAVAYSKIQPGRPSLHRIMVCQHLHLAVGYPGVRFLPDLQKYREETGDATRVVNAYENHEHVYADLSQNGGIVLVRGRGIVASRIIQKLYEIRTEHHVPIGILHLMRTPVPEGHNFGRAQRQVDNHWEFQPFNWPKAAWSGTLREDLENANEQERDLLLNEWGGTTTADRRDWRQIVSDGLREGWYEIQFGEVEKVEPHPDGKVATIARSRSLVERRTELLADYIIDATGLDSSIDSNVLLKDLLQHYRLPRNPKHRLHVSNTFEIEGLRNGSGRVYASGVITLGGPYAAVDSFLGLQYAALRSVDDLVAQGAPGLRRLNGVRSLSQWWRWVRGVAP